MSANDLPAAVRALGAVPAPAPAAAPAPERMDVPALWARCEQAIRDAGGQRPFVLLATPGHHDGRRYLLRMGPARLWGRVVGWRDLGKPTVATVCRLWVDDVLRELLRARLVTREAAAVPEKTAFESLAEVLDGAVAIAERGAP